MPATAPGPDNDLADKLDHYVQRAAAAPAARLYAFGQRWGPEPTRDKVFGFAPGNGIHDIHMNQGNSPQFEQDDGVWQDGGLLAHYPAQGQKDGAWSSDRPVGGGVSPRRAGLTYASWMAFSGWPTEAVEFYKGLEADNTKPYWTAHKPVFDASVYAPMADLLTELADEFGEGRIARPYRDVRFSADKSPYKTSIYAILDRGGYVNFSADGLVAGMGYYQMGPDQLDRYRRAVADDASGPELVGIVDRLTGDKVEVAGSSSLKRVPKGYPAEHPRGDLLRHKGLIAWRRWPVASWLHTGAAKQRVVGFLRAAAPLQAWLDEQVGPSTAEPRGRR